MSEQHHKTPWGVKAIKILFPLLLLAAGGVAWSYFQATAPVLTRSAPKPQTTIIEAITAASGNTRPFIEAMGTVVASREVILKAQVSGMVESVSDRFVPGRIIEKGAKILSLDAADYEVELKKARSALANAKAALAIEQGAQNIAREELNLLSELTPGKTSKTDLALRKPQLEQAQADVISAEADLRQAKLNLSRCKVAAPFNAMITERSVNIGSYVGAQESLATIVGTDEFWVEAMVSLDKVSLIDLGYPGGCPVKVVSQGSGEAWDGRVLEIKGALNETSRMAVVLIEIRNPLGSPETPSTARLMIDDYVHVEITARELSNVIEIPRPALQEGSTVWINKNGALDIRPVSVVWKSVDKVYLKDGVAPGEQVVVSDLSTPVNGMPLTTAGDGAAEPVKNEATL